MPNKQNSTTNIDSGPNIESENKQSVDEAQPLVTEINPVMPASKDKVGFDESLGMKTRHYKGSTRPPDIPGEIWAMMTPKDRQVAKDRYAKTGYGFPNMASKDAEKSKPNGSTSSMNFSRELTNVPEMPTLAIRS